MIIAVKLSKLQKKDEKVGLNVILPGEIFFLINRLMAKQHTTMPQFFRN